MSKNLFFFFFIITACQPPASSEPRIYQKISGQTMGVVTYNITYASETNYQSQIDSLMNAINNELSTYVPASAISSFNRSLSGIEKTNDLKHFLKNIDIALKCSEESKGAFDPTIMPLVNYWGFGYAEKEALNEGDKVVVDSLLRFVGIGNIDIREDKILKSNPKVQLDFSASAKGYFVDEVARFLEINEVESYMVEIGGEIRTAGENPMNRKWKMGVNVPREGSSTTDLFASITLGNASVATSGNYRNYYTVDGITYSHTINPKTGLPERTNLLSASVITKECAYADAYATACMVMGLEQSKIFIDSIEDVEAYFIYSNSENALEAYATKGIADQVTRF